MKRNELLELVKSSKRRFVRATDGFSRSRPYRNFNKGELMQCGLTGEVPARVER